MKRKTLLAATNYDAHSYIFFLNLVKKAGISLFFFQSQSLDDEVVVVFHNNTDELNKFRSQ